jgi:hypothetical protein
MGYFQGPTVYFPEDNGNHGGNEEKNREINGEIRTSYFDMEIHGEIRGFPQWELGKSWEHHLFLWGYNGIFMCAKMWYNLQRAISMGTMINLDLGIPCFQTKPSPKIGDTRGTKTNLSTNVDEALATSIKDSSLLASVRAADFQNYVLLIFGGNWRFTRWYPQL